jgi:EAL domain-containing protein (putative c-di-GMP-specific phosphodiesterase class I)
MEGILMNGEADFPGAALNAPDALFLMRRVVEQALTLITSAEGAAIFRADGDMSTCVCASGNLQHSLGTLLPLSGSLSGLALRTGETLACENSVLDDRVDKGTCRCFGIASGVCIPLRRGTDLVGVLILTSTRRRAFEAESVALLSSMSAFISDAVLGWSDLARSAAPVLAAGQCTGDRLFDRSSTTRGGEQETAAAERVTQFVANVLQPAIVDNRHGRRRMEAVLAGLGLSMRFQPIIDLRTGRLAGCEALAHFAGPPTRSPEVWFAEARRVGLGAELQLAAIKKAFVQLPNLPPELYMAVNIGPDIAGAPELLNLLHNVDSGRVVIELTEHLQVEDYPALITAVRDIRATGARLAIDDTGAGYAGFSSILKLAPDLIKLDRILTTGIDLDPARQALGSALVTFAAATNAQVIAEGIETVGELDVIRRLGIAYGQGYFLGHPGTVTTLTTRAGARPRTDCADQRAKWPAIWSMSKPRRIAQPVARDLI